MTLVMIAAILLFIAVELYEAVRSIAKIEKGITSLSAEIRDYISDLQQDHRETRRRFAEGRDGMTEWMREHEK